VISHPPPTRSPVTLPARLAVASLFAEDRASLVAHLSCMQSGHGFINDLRPTPVVTADVGQPPS